MGSLSFNRWMGLAAMLSGMLALVLVVMLVLAIIDLPSYSQWYQAQDPARQEACTKYPRACHGDFSDQGRSQAIFLLLGLLWPAPVVWGYVIARRMGIEERQAGRLKASLVLALIGLVLTLAAGFAALGFGLTAVSPILGFLGWPASFFGMILFGVYARRMPSRRLRELPTHKKIIMWALFYPGKPRIGQRIFAGLLSGIAVLGLHFGRLMAPFLVIAVLLGMVVLADAYAIWGGYSLWVSGDETDG